MKKTKSQSGITLIALIITILVLLILAGVAIKSIKDGGIITKAEQAADKYTQAQNDELAMLDEYTAEILLSQPQIGEVTGLEVGDFIKYGEDLYMVLHNNSSEGLQIISTQIKEDLNLKGLDDFENRLQRFKETCAPYVKKSLGAIDGRVPYYTFNEIKNLTTKEFTLELANGTNRVLKVYQRKDGANQDEENNLAIALTKAMQNNIYFTKDFWLATYSSTLGAEAATKDCYLQYLSAQDTTIKKACLATYSVTDKTITETEETKGILPIILLDSRITIKTTNDAGETLDGSTPAKAYEYTFNK